MSRGFWDSSVGREIRWRQRESRTRCLRLEGEPERKRKGNSVHVIEDQRKLIEQLQLAGHPVLRGPVVLDLTFQVANRQPPAIHHLAKYLLDVLGLVHHQNTDLGHQHVLYRDDQQVRLLRVQVERPWVTGAATNDSTRAGTRIQARPLRDVVEDLRVVSDLQSDADYASSWDDEDNADSPFYLPEIPDPPPEPVFAPDQAASSEQARQWVDLNKWFAVHDQSHVQEILLKRTDAHIASVILSSASQICGAHSRRRIPYTISPVSELIKEITDLDRRVLLSGPLTLPIPGLPRVHGEGDIFLHSVRQYLEQLRSRWPVFSPLLVPVKVIFIVVTPERQNKDLDNIALKILPLVHEVLQPPLVPILPRDTQLLDDGSPGNEETPERPQYIRTNNVTAYEVIELKRTDNDPPHGHLRIALGSGSQRDSTWSRVIKLCEKANE